MNVSILNLAGLSHSISLTASANIPCFQGFVPHHIPFPFILWSWLCSTPTRTRNQHVQISLLILSFCRTTVLVKIMVLYPTGRYVNVNVDEIVARHSTERWFDSAWKNIKNKIENNGMEANVHAPFLFMRQFCQKLLKVLPKRTSTSCCCFSSDLSKRTLSRSAALFLFGETPNYLLSFLNSQPAPAACQDKAKARFGSVSCDLRNSRLLSPTSEVWL